MTNIVRTENPSRLRWAVTLITLFVFCGGLGYGCFVPRHSADKFRQEVEADLPIGTPRSKVEHWLESRNCVLYGIADSNRQLIGIGGRIDNAGPLLDSNTEIRFDFYFDTDDKLTKFSVRTFTYSL